MAKAKIAHRVIKLLEYFAEAKRPVTVTELATRYQWPQSSTSELLTELVRLGVLYKNIEGRNYTPTPKLVGLGRALQSQPIGDGRLFSFMQRLSRTTPCAVGVFGIVGGDVQVFEWMDGTAAAKHKISVGSAVRLFSSPVGLLLLSTLNQDLAAKVLWRLYAESEVACERFDLREAKSAVAKYRSLGYAVGRSGFSCGADIAALLLPVSTVEPPLALGAVYPSNANIDPNAMLTTLAAGVEQSFVDAEDQTQDLVRGAGVALWM